MKARPTKRSVVNLWTAGFAGAAVIQGIFPRRFAKGTVWGHNAGWQREIAIWNIGTLATIAALRRDPGDVDKSLITGFTTLAALFGANHLVAALSSPHSIGNWAGAATNGVTLAAGVNALRANGS